MQRDNKDIRTKALKTIDHLVTKIQEDYSSVTREYLKLKTNLLK